MSIENRVRRLEQTAGANRCIHHAQVIRSADEADRARCPSCGQPLVVAILPGKLSPDAWIEVVARKQTAANIERLIAG